MSLNCSIETNRIDPNTVSIKFIVGGWLTLVFCVFGIITNIFTIIVLSHPRMRNSSTHVYLMALSACNIFLAAGLMINYSLKSIASYPELLAYLRQPTKTNRKALLANSYEQFYAHVAPFTTPLLSMLLLCSTYLTVLVSGDRYFLICWPSIAEKVRTRTMALRLVLLVFILVNIYIFPHWFEYRTAYSDLSSNLTNINQTLTDTEMKISKSSEKRLVELSYGRLGSNRIYLSIYRLYLNIPITFVIPFTLLALCNGSMIYKLVLIRKKKKRLGRRMKADIRITTMLIVIVLTFMLCRSINLFVNLIVQLTPCLNKNSLHRFNTLANVLIAFNGFVNFFLFAAFGQRFREMVLAIFFRRGRYRFASMADVNSTIRAGRSGIIVSPDVLRRQLQRGSVNDSEVWTLISRRRSSATMVGGNNTSENPQKSISDVNAIPLNPSNALYINGKAADQSNSSVHVTESSFPIDHPVRDIPSSQRSSSGNTLLVPGDPSAPTKIPSPSCIKKKPDETLFSVTHHVKFL